MPLTRKCSECGKDQDSWRSCSYNDCDHEVCYCSKDGGDVRAAKEMEQHIAEHIAA